MKVAKLRFATDMSFCCWGIQTNFTSPSPLDGDRFAVEKLHSLSQQLLDAKTDEHHDAVFNTVYGLLDSYWDSFHTLNLMLAWIAHPANVKRVSVDVMITWLRPTANMQSVLTHWVAARDACATELDARGLDSKGLLQGLFDE